MERTAQAQSQPPSAWIAARVPMLLPTRKPRPVLTPEERTSAMARLSRHIGYADMGDPDSANNARIVADVARECWASLAWLP